MKSKNFQNPSFWSESTLFKGTFALWRPSLLNKKCELWRPAHRGQW